jgi:hypothetical protein
MLKFSRLLLGFTMGLWLYCLVIVVAMATRTQTIPLDNAFYP